jgi:large subunit ribosomal protein L22
MEVFASLKYLKIAPRKVRLVTGLIKGMTYVDAREQLKRLPKRSSDDILKLLDSCKANAVNNFNLNPEDLIVRKINVTAGPIYKRMLPVARGSAHIIRHRMSHVNMYLVTRDELKKNKK